MDLYVLGDPKISVVAFASRNPARLNIHAVGDAMGKKGWHLNGLANPAALHMAFTVSMIRLGWSVVHLFVSSGAGRTTGSDGTSQVVGGGEKWK